MRYSQLFGKTRHNPPCDADSKNAQLLTQAGFVEKLAAGIYNILPLGQKVLAKICKIIREEMNAVDGQELLMPALHPIELWEITGRNKTMDSILYRTKASGDKEFVFGPSHEETVTPLVAKYIKSYKDLPLVVYQIQTKFRDEPRAKSGLLRGREFGMKDMYSFHVTEEDLDKYYEKVKKAYFNVFERCGLKAYLIEASGGPFSDKYSHEFSVETPAGEDTIIICDKCGTAQNLEIAEGKVPDPDARPEKELPLEQVHIERGFSIGDNAKAHGVPSYKILKTVVYEVDETGLIGVVIRGDLSVSEVKLENYLKKPLRSASPELLKQAGLVQGYISPVNLPSKIKLKFIADHSIKNVKNFVTGANAYAQDYKNANIGRDFIIDDFTDLVEVKSGFKCKKCDKPLKEIKAVEVGNIFKLGAKYSRAFNLNFTDKDGKSKLVTMGCYGIGTTRLLGTVVESKYDKNGIIWPKNVAPFTVHLVSLGKDPKAIKEADKLYEKIKESGVEVLYDDRNESAGVKFKDADLIGIPLRIVISERTLEKESVEWKLRDSEKPEFVKISDVVKKISAL
ncbi:MAG: proline--tRNA ligase [Patescibacteria group bacterium]